MDLLKEHSSLLISILLFLIIYYTWFYFFYKKNQKHIKNINYNSDNIKNIDIFAPNDNDVIVHNPLDVKLVDNSRKAKTDWKTALDDLNTTSEDILNDNKLNNVLGDFDIDLKED